MDDDEVPLHQYSPNKLAYKSEDLSSRATMKRNSIPTKARIKEKYKRIDYVLVSVNKIFYFNTTGLYRTY